MAGMGLSGGMAAGAGADQLETLLRRKFAEAQAAQQAKEFAAKLAIEQQSANDNTEYRKAALQDRVDARTAAAQAGLSAQGEKIGAGLTPGTNVAGQTDVINALTAAGLKPQHTDATLGSRNISGMVSTGDVGPGIGDAPRISNLRTTANPGQDAKDIFQGTAQQHQAEQARTDKIAAMEAERKAKVDAAAQGKTDKEDLLKLTASLRPAPQAPLVLMQTVDEQGNPTQRFVKKEEGASYAKPKGANAALDNRIASAKVVNDVGTDMIHKLSDPKFIAAVGPAMGRASTLRDFIGNPPPEFSELAGQIESYALANMGVHGMRSAQGAEQIKKLLDQHHTPESLAATIRGLNDFSTRLVNDNAQKPSGSAATPSSTGASAPKAIRYDMNGKVIKD